MRKAYSDFGFVTLDEKFIGISLGYDFTAEHEWGYDDLKRDCGIPERNKKTMGIKSRKITKKPILIFIVEKYKGENFAILYTGNRYHSNEKLPYELSNYKEDILWNKKYDEKRKLKEEDKKYLMVTAWDSNGFGIGVMGDENIMNLKALKEGFENNNIVITYLNLGGNNPFSNSSLSILLADRLPKIVIDQFYLNDKVIFDLKDYEKKIGMKKLIDNKGNNKRNKYFMACSPKWIDYHNEEKLKKLQKKYKTKYKIIYWINYSDNDNNYGWYSVEEIKKWLTSDKKLIEIRKG